jgi:hypothetical protein
MVVAVPDFARWLQDAAVPQAKLNDAQRAVLQAAFAFQQRCGHDYYSIRLLSHFLLHAQLGLPVAHVARLLRLSRSAASAQQGLSSKEVVQAANHRLRGRSHGKLLPRFAGPIAHFLHQHKDATRWDLLDFLRESYGVSVSRMALHNFLKKYGLDADILTLTKPSAAASDEPAILAATDATTARQTVADVDATVAAQPSIPPSAGQPLPPPAFFLPRPATPAPS